MRPYPGGASQAPDRGGRPDQHRTQGQDAAGWAHGRHPERRRAWQATGTGVPGDQHQAAGGIIEGEREMTQDIRTEQAIRERDIREGRHNAHGHMLDSRLANSDARQQTTGISTWCPPSTRSVCCGVSAVGLSLTAVRCQG